MGFFRVSIITLFLLSLYRYPLREIPKSKGMILFILVGIMSCSFHFFNAVDTSHFTNLFLAFLGMIIIYQHIDKPETYYKYIVISLLINLYLYLMQVAGFNPIPSFSCKDAFNNGVWGSFFGTTPRFNSYMALCIPFVLYCKEIRPLLRYALIVVILISCTLVAHIEIMIFLTTAIVLICSIQNRKLRTYIILILIISGLIIINQTHVLTKVTNSINLRIDNWQSNLQQLKQYPILYLIGYGISYPRGCPTLAINQDPTLLGDHFQYSLCLGVFGILFMVYAWSKFFFNFKSNQAESLTILVLFLLCFFEYSLQLLRCWHLIIIALGFKLIKDNKLCIKN
jgi:hypothetical protein